MKTVYLVLIFMPTLLKRFSDFTAPCSPFCDSTYGCWGKSSEQCTRCSNFTDLTNSNGQIVPEWIVDSDGKTFPGNNVSTCVQVCNFTKGLVINF